MVKHASPLQNGFGRSTPRAFHSSPTVDSPLARSQSMGEYSDNISTSTRVKYGRGMLAASKLETVLISATGDVLVCRSRDDESTFALSNNMPGLLGGENANDDNDTNGTITTEDEISYKDFDDNGGGTFLENCLGCDQYFSSVDDNGVRESRRIAPSASGKAETCDEGCDSELSPWEWLLSSNGRGGLMGGGGSSDYCAVAAAESKDDDLLFDVETTNTRYGDASPVILVEEDRNEEAIRVRLPSKSEPDASDASLYLTSSFDSMLPSFDYSHMQDDETVIRGALTPKQPSLPSVIEGDLEIELDETSHFPHRTATQPNDDETHDHWTLTPPKTITDFPSNNVHPKRQHSNEQSVPELAAPDPPPLLHGVPTFLSHLNQIRITKVSAHPMGGHVLLISEEGLLFSYGQNDRGQLGNGTKGNFFVSTPSVVTPLLENGGKTIDCAAGMNHSLVVVMTEGRRVGRLHREHRQNKGHNSKLQRNKQTNDYSPVRLVRGSSSPNPTIRTGSDGDMTHPPSPSSRSATANEMMCHHQVYGFGGNNHMKLGLVNPPPIQSISKTASSSSPIQSIPSEEEEDEEEGSEDEEQEEEDVLLPRRVALHCKVWPGQDNNTSGHPSIPTPPPYGVFAVAAGEVHSAALVRRATGVIEMYTWGKSEGGMLGINPHEGKRSNKENSGARRKNQADDPMKGFTGVVPLPTIVNKFSNEPLYDPQPPLYDHHPLPPSHKVKTRKSILSHIDYPSALALGPRCTIVLTSDGRCMSMGKSNDGLLGLGEGIRSSVGPSDILFSKGAPTRVKSVSLGARHALAVTDDGSVYMWGVSSSGRLGIKGSREVKKTFFGESEYDGDKVVWTPQKVPLWDNHKKEVIHNYEYNIGGIPLSTDDDGGVESGCAGCDSSIFVTKSGCVMSCGVASGRLGQGEIMDDCHEPQPMMGGLRIWRSQQQQGDVWWGR